MTETKMVYPRPHGRTLKGVVLATVLVAAGCDGGVGRTAPPVVPDSEPLASATDSTPGRAALAALYHSTGGDRWYNDDGWLTEKPLGEWYGVRTDGSGNVVSLSLSANFLNGKVPPEMGQLAHLTYLNLSYNHLLEGPLPAEFFELPKLRILILSGTNMGFLPPELGRLAELRQLFMSRAGLVGPIPPEAGNLSELRYAELGYNQLFGEIPAELGNLSNLTVLNLSWSRLTGPIPAELAGLSRLTHLNLSRNDLTGELPVELGDLRALRNLYLGENRLTGPVPPEWGDLENLETMDLGVNRLTGPVPPTFQNLRSLSRLSLHDNALAGLLPDSLGKLAGLQRLWVGDNPGLTGPVPASVTALRSLESFNAGGTGLCAPQDTGFLAWLGGVPFHRLSRCEVAAAYLTQAVQSREFPVPLASGRPALLRIFLASERANGEKLPPARATFYLDGAEIHVAEIPAGTASIPNRVDEGSLASSLTADIPAAVVRPGLEMKIDVDPDSTLDPELGIPTRIPATGRMAVDVADLADLKLTLVPFLYELDPDSSILETTAGMAERPDQHPMLDQTRTFLPIGGWDIRLHEPVISSSNNGYSILRETELIRLIEGRPGYWLSMAAPVVEFGLLGVAYGVPSWTSFSLPLPTTVAHELGHNMGLWHAPGCYASGPDPLYPHPSGTIGSWGYDFDHKKLVSPFAPDIMSYCGGQWISDYHRANALRHRVNTELATTAGFGAKVSSVLVWGGVGAGGALFLEPSFLVDALPSPPPAGADFALSGGTEEGEAFSFNFDMPKCQDAEDERCGFVFAIPVTWEGELATITLAGPDGSVVLNEDSHQPMTILRDAATGEIRAILRRPPEQAADAAGAQAREVLFSRGIPR